jgi:transposase
MLYLAIDQHRKQLTVNERDEVGNVLLRRQVSTRWQAVRTYFEELQARSREHGGFVVILEVCGFNDWLLQMLQDYGAQEIVLLQPEDQQRQKTDRRDANRLGELLWVNRARLLAGQRVQGMRRVAIPSEQERADRLLTALRWRVGCQLTRVLNGVRHVLRRHNLEQECPTKGIQTKAALKWLRELPLSALERLEMDHLLERWQLLEQERAILDEQIRQRQGQHEPAAILATIPGVGAFTSLALASRVGDIGRFPRPRSLANYWGLTPGCCNSGEATQRLGSITKRGSALARFLLGQVVVHVLRKDAVLRSWYKEVKRRRGSKTARVAVMRRLATIMWHLLQKKEKYVCGGPRRRRQETAAAKLACAEAPA